MGGCDNLAAFTHLILDSSLIDYILITSQGTLRADHAKKELKDLRGTVKTQQSANSKTLNEMEGLKRAILAAEERYRGLSYNEAEEATLRGKAAELEASTAILRDEVRIKLS
jgi:predicted RNase H-like nuclease (RuvC/YqgF family)